MKLRVQCYAGRKADERPVRFQLDERDYMIEEIVDQWYGPDDTFFKVRADDGNLYILCRRRWKRSGAWKRFASSKHNPVQCSILNPTFRATWNSSTFPSTIRPRSWTTSNQSM